MIFGINEFPGARTYALAYLPIMNVKLGDFGHGGRDPLTRPEEIRMGTDLARDETCFFREPGHFDHLRSLLRERHSARFRVWSAACSTGEEAYSIAMVLAEKLPPQGWEVLASDISARVLDTARKARYPIARAAQMPPDYLRRFCMTSIDAEGGALRMSSALRACVDFAQIKLNAPRLPDLGRFDVIFLRNVLTYFDDEARRHVAQRVLVHLRNGGYLYVGHSEDIGSMGLPLRIMAPAIYRKE